MTRILALDLGKYKTVACAYVPATGEARFATAETTVDHLAALIGRERPDLTVLETCTLAGWVHDRASRLISSPNTTPTWSRPTSARSLWNPGRPSAVAPLLPWSSSMPSTRSAGQPSSTARPARAYWRSADSRLVVTWWAVDWRT